MAFLNFTNFEKWSKALIDARYNEKYYPKDKDKCFPITLKELGTENQFYKDNPKLKGLQFLDKNTEEFSSPNGVILLPELTKDCFIFKQGEVINMEPYLFVVQNNEIRYVCNKKIEDWVKIKIVYQDGFSNYIISLMSLYNK